LQKIFFQKILKIFKKFFKKKFHKIISENNFQIFFSEKFVQLQTIVDFRKNIFNISDKILQLPNFSEISEITFSKFSKFSGNSETQLSTSRKNCATPEKMLRHSGKKFATCRDIPKKNFQTLRHPEKKV